MSFPATLPGLTARSAAAAALALSAAACASVEPPRAAAPVPAPVPGPVVAVSPPSAVRANAPIPNPPERRAGGSGGASSAARALGPRIGKPYQVAGVWYVPAEQPDYDTVGAASWYGDAFHGRPTASGEVFDMHLPSAAHATLPLRSLVEVTNLDNHRSIQVRVNDRGPFKPGRIIDLSRQAADQLGFVSQGTAKVRVRYVGPAPMTPSQPFTAPSDALFAALARKAEPARTPRPQRRPEPAILAAAAAFAPGPTAAPGYTVQAGAFSNKGNAERAARALGAIGPAEVRTTERDGEVLYRVLVGAWPVRDGAARALGAVAEAGFPDARVVSAS